MQGVLCNLGAILFKKYLKTAWKASCARPWAKRVRATVGRLEQRQAALNELVSLYDGLQASRYDRQGGKTTRETGDESTVALIARIDAMPPHLHDIPKAFED